MNVISTDKLTKYYGENRGIIDVSLNVSEGEVYGFIGPNGAGKSTTIRALLSLIFPTSGSAKIFGKDCYEYAPEIKQEIGYLPSEVFYYDKMKVSDLLKYAASFYNRDCLKRTAELVDIMELDTSRKISELSFGNKKKVGIVQGLMHSPKLILLDEPTSGLDPLMQQKFFELVREENARGATIFFSSHILAEVQKLCTRVAIIKDGAIIKEDDINSLSEDKYKRVNIRASKSIENPFNYEGVTNLTRNEQGNTTSFMYKGDINLILKELSKIKVDDITINEPSLEEIFMHYYE